ncbi:lycopene cyclase domain-containing protein [Dietzia maris]|uniref:lycopene cyclase domain-containing protein n=1 Tax=Dietzia TaxID=37914 RepID=UPI001F4E26CB|nr:MULTISPECIES: lycopene cyclase domain-containing protein [Dietzia]MCZ4539389.1 lycopene cyclase domain-containing protein [Dietzia maris]MCZ4656147.1 lycopene cyclase domain-containing protein [Dietzia kunjamensis]MDV3354637.1 lycopene cyclase domain-containing protein [Dietzia sp. IN118]
MIGLAYLAVQVISFAGILVIDHRWKLAAFRAPAATALAVTAAVALLLTWDVLGVRSGVFFRGQTDFMTGLLVAPEIPLEEVVFLAFLSHLALVCATGVVTAVEHISRRRGARSGGARSGGAQDNGAQNDGAQNGGAQNGGAQNDGAGARP